MAALVAAIIRVNLPLSVLLIYITNPVTIPPMFYLAYKFGAWLLGETVHTISFSLSVEWLRETAILIWQPLLLGCTIFAIVSAIVGYYGVHLFWRLRIMQRINDRREQHRQKRHQKRQKQLEEAFTKKLQKTQEEEEQEKQEKDHTDQ